MKAETLVTAAPAPRAVRRDFPGITTLKGIGVLLIMLHHYCRSLWNSQHFDMPAITQWQWHEAVHDTGVAFDFPGVGGWIIHALATYAFLGVHLFIVASGVGLGIRYAAKGPRPLEFASRRILKILLPVWAALLIYSALEYAAGRGFDLGVLLRKMTMLSFFDEHEFFAIVSPLWYIALIFQLYLLFPFIAPLVRRSPWVVLPVLTIVAVVYRAMTQCEYGDCTNQYWSHGAALNWLGVFFAGVLAGQKFAGEALPRSRRATMGFAAAGAALWLLYLGSQWVRALYPVGDTAFGLGALCWVLALWQRFAGVERWLAPLARNSFGAYLYHRPLMAYFALRWVRLVGEQPWLLLLGGALACAAMLVGVAVVTKLAARSRVASTFFFGG